MTHLADLIHSFVVATCTYFIASLNILHILYCAHHPSCADDVHVHVRVHDMCCVLTAWLLRLPEVVRASGLLLVVSAGPYGETALLPHLTDRCVRVYVCTALRSHVLHFVARGLSCLISFSCPILVVYKYIMCSVHTIDMLF